MGYDVIFVGGGLAAGLGALSLLEARPEAAIAIVEAGPTLGGNHTWCFHAADLPGQAEAFVAPLIAQRWSGYEVRFPRRMRRLDSPYACITSERLHAVVQERLARSPSSKLLLDARADAIDARRVRLADGRELDAALVIDARGPELPPKGAPSGYQKFVGLEVSVDPEHALDEPVLMDACVRQHDGFRCVYVLPFARDRLLIEDTFFSDGPELDETRVHAAVLAYAKAQGFRVREVLRTESGVLPMPFRAAPPSVHAGEPIVAGYRGGYFHPVTGYSFPLAVRFALALAETRPSELDSSPLAALARSHAEQLPFLLLLTRLMFTCFAPEQRFRVLEHFYRLPKATIERFYAAQLTSLDRARVFWGAPPRGLSLKHAMGLAEASP